MPQQHWCVRTVISNAITDDVSDVSESELSCEDNGDALDDAVSLHNLNVSIVRK